ncbi:MAG TPA: hypothetical protein VNO33_04015 [Kofleriaceae bacterium]|nr:hypothetical protein [Kofleriaceae bacterium]
MTLEETTQSGNKSKSAESKGAESKGAESKGAESKGAVNKGAENKGAESKSREEDGGETIAEGKTTKAIEQVTARAPSQMWLWMAGAGIAGSMALYLSGRRQAGIFVGLWPLTFLVMGNYNKIVKSVGSR